MKGCWAQDPEEMEKLEMGQSVTVYVVQKSEDTVKVASTPLQE